MIFMSSQYLSAQETIIAKDFYKMIVEATIVPTIIRIFYLLVTLIVVVKITGHNMGPIRSNKR